MKTDFRPALRTNACRVLAAIGLTAVAASASALPTFTFNPTAVGLSGSAPITANNIIISDYSAVQFSGSSFSESGYLSVTSFQSGGTTLSTPGLNSSYGFYIAFTGTGTSSGSLPSTSGNFTSLNYTLYGYNGTATFGFSGSTPTVTGTSGVVALAIGSLTSGTVGTYPQPPSFGAYAAATVSFTPEASGFFVSPMPFYTNAVSSFINSSSQVTPIANGFLISQGGGSFNFVTSPIPEPETYGLMLAGFAAMAMVVRRRRS